MSYNCQYEIAVSGVGLCPTESTCKLKQSREDETSQLISPYHSDTETAMLSEEYLDLDAYILKNNANTETAMQSGDDLDACLLDLSFSSKLLLCKSESSEAFKIFQSKSNQSHMMTVKRLSNI